MVWDEARLLVPPEDPARSLLPLDRAAGEDALPVRAFLVRVGIAAALLALGGSVLLLLGRRGPIARPAPGGGTLVGPRAGE
jgi:hypothetical protein